MFVVPSSASSVGTTLLLLLAIPTAGVLATGALSDDVLSPAIVFLLTLVALAAFARDASVVVGCTRVKSQPVGWRVYRRRLGTLLIRL